MPTAVFGAGTGLLEDAWVRRADASWPPVTETTNSSAAAPTCQRNFSTPNYQVTQFLFRWDTSTIPDDATITSAELRLWVNSKTNIDGYAVGGRWHNSWDGNPAGDYLLDPTSNAFSGVTLGSLTSAAENIFALANPTNVNKSGNTGLHVYVEGAQPTGSNGMTCRMSEDTTAAGDEPRLVVAYTEAGGQSHTRIIPDSIAVSDTRQRVQAHRRLISGLTYDDLAATTYDALASTTFDSMSEGLAVADSATRVVGSVPQSFTRTISDSLPVADNAARTPARKRALADSIAVGDSPSRAITIVTNRTVSDLLALADSASRRATYKRLVAEASLALQDGVQLAGTGIIPSLPLAPEIVVRMLSRPDGRAVLLAVPDAVVAWVGQPSARVVLLADPSAGVQMLAAPLAKLR